MDNYTNNDQNSYGSSNGYPVDPNNNSYHYTGTDNTDNTSGNTYSTYSSYSSAQTGTDQSHDRYYSPYERRTMEENPPKAKKPKKQQSWVLRVILIQPRSLLKFKKKNKPILPPITAIWITPLSAFCAIIRFITLNPCTWDILTLYKRCLKMKKSQNIPIIQSFCTVLRYLTTSKLKI